MNRDSFATAAALAAVLTLAAPAVVRAGDFEVNPDAGNNSFSAVFDAKLGERINAVSSAVGCQVTYDEKTGLASGTCSVPSRASASTTTTPRATTSASGPRTRRATPPSAASRPSSPA